MVALLGLRFVELKFKRNALVPLTVDDQLYPLLPTLPNAPKRPLFPASR